MSADTYQVLHAPAAAPGSVSYTGTAGSISQAVRGNLLMVWCTTDAYVTVGSTATTSNGTPIPSYQVFWLPIPDAIRQGQTPTVLVSAIQVTSGGTLYAQQFN